MFSIFLKEKKKLKSVNSLDLIPVSLVKYEMVENGKIKLIVPRFKNKILLNIFTGKRISAYFKVSLDETGSKIWLLIDGEKSVDEISKKLDLSGNEKENRDEQLTAFITKLYREGFITFHQLLQSKR